MTGPEKKPPPPAGSLVGLGIALGAGMGVALGAAFDNVGMGLAIGVGVGSALGAGLEARKGKNKRESRVPQQWAQTSAMRGSGAGPRWRTTARRAWRSTGDSWPKSSRVESLGRRRMG